MRAAVEATPVGHPDRARWLSNLGRALRLRFERTGMLPDLDEAVTIGRAAAEATPPDDPDRAVMLSNLGAILQRRFERTGVLADLEESVAAMRAAMEATPADHPDRALMLSNLGSALRLRFERTSVLADLDEAVMIGRAAAEATPADDPDRAGMLSNLGVVLVARFERTGILADLDEAVIAMRAAVEATPAGHADRAGMLSNLGSALRNRFERSRVLADLDEAVTIGRAAVKATPADHADRALTLTNLGSALWLRFERNELLGDLNDALTAFREAAAVEMAPPRVRVVAARSWGRVAGVGGRWRDAVEGFEMAVGLLGRVAPRSLVRHDQERLLENLGGLASEAAECCLHVGLTDRAAELFEQGRGILLGQALDTRTDLTVLAELYPDLAKRFTALRDDLDRFDGRSLRPATWFSEMKGSSGSGSEATRLEVESQRENAEAFDRVIAEIRTKQGFASFLCPLQGVPQSLLCWS